MLKLWQAEVLENPGTPGVIRSADKHGVVIGCGHESLRVTELQREGGRRLGAQEFLAGQPLVIGLRLGR